MNHVFDKLLVMYLNSPSFPLSTSATRLIKKYTAWITINTSN